MRSLRLSPIVICGLLLAPACSDDNGTKPDYRRPVTELGVDEQGTTPGADNIFDINKEVIKAGAKVVLKDVVFTAYDGYGTAVGNAYVQEVKGGANSGITLYRPTRTDGPISDLKAGDHVKVEGTVKHFTGTKESPFDAGKRLIEIDPATVTKISAGAAPTPADVTTDDLTQEPAAKSWVGVLVRVKNVGVTKAFDPKYSDFQVSGLSVDDDLFLQQPGPKLGDCVTVTGVFMYFYVYKLMPRFAEDFAAGTGCAAVKTVTVKDIQDETSANHPAVNTVVNTSGVVTAIDTIPYGTTKAFQGFWIEDAAGGVRSGIYVYYNWTATTPAASIPVIGHTVDVSGKYVEYKSSSATSPETLSEIQDTTMTDKGAGTVPAAAVVPAADVANGGGKTEDYEGVLIKVENLEVGEIVSTTGSTPKPIGFKDKASGLFVQAEIFDFMSTPPTVGTKYTSVTGVLNYLLEKWMILPRMTEDLVK